MSSFWKAVFIIFGVLLCIRGCIGLFYEYDKDWWVNILVGLTIIGLEILFTKRKRK